MALKTTIRAWIGRSRSEEGSVSAEAVLMMPLLIWAWVAMYVFFEGLRENNINLKASYTVSDLLSRETDEIDMDYLNGMNNVFAWLTRSQNPVSIRVTFVQYDQASNMHKTIWSRGVNGKPNLTQSEVSATLSPSIPIMADADTAIVVETWAHFDPIFDMGYGKADIYNLVVTAPRYSEQLVLDGVNDGTGSGHDDGTDDGNTGTPTAS